MLVLDEAQHLSERFLLDLSGFLNFAFDSRELIAVWLVGLPAIARRLRMQVHAPLRTRLAAQVHLEALNRTDFGGDDRVFRVFPASLRERRRSPAIASQLSRDDRDGCEDGELTPENAPAST